jgi:hypothetical protein
MAQPLELPLPADLDLDDTFQIRVTAIDATTGAVVSGVKVGAVTLIVDNLTGGDLTSGSFGPFLLVPGQQA